MTTASPRPVWRRAQVPAAVLGVVLLVAAAVWSLSAARSLTADPTAVAVGSGVAHVDKVLSAARPQHAMPGMGSDDDPVAEGQRRVTVELTLEATGEEPLRFSVSDFALRTGEGKALAPHRSLLPETEMPAGTTLSGVLVFDVPRDATVGQLSYDGGEPVELRLPAEEASRPAPSGSVSPSSEPSHDPTHAP
jgi:Domain of unknown function (DUF4352)